MHYNAFGHLLEDLEEQADVHGIKSKLFLTDRHLLMKVTWNLIEEDMEVVGVVQEAKGRNR